jgi:hypothetical protein
VQRRKGTKEWLEILAEYECSGQTQRKFCEEAGLSLATFGLWRRRTGKTKVRAGGAKSRMIEVAVAVQEDAGLVLEGGGGWALKLPSTVSPRWVAEVLRELRCGA